VTAGPHDDAASAILGRAEALGTWLAIWGLRDDARHAAHSRRCANDAMDAIDAMLRDLHEVRARLVAETRQFDDATAERAEELLRGRGSRPLER
jgi:hypothetical protein